MKNIQYAKLINNHRIILSLILLLFFLKGVFLSTAFPIFDGQDEARHYNTIQFLNQPKDAVENTARPIIDNKNLFTDYNFSDEIIQAGTEADIDALRSGIYNTIDYSGTYDGKNEEAINANDAKPYNHNIPADMVQAPQQFYHSICAIIEKTFSNQSILVRFYLIRIFSVLLGVLFVLLSYLIAKTIGFSSKHALILAAIISFQPKFSMYFAGINYDTLLIPMFALFTLGGLLSLKNGLNWKNGSLMTFSIIIAILTKSTGYILLIPFACLLAYFIFEKVSTKSKNVKYGAYVLSFLAFIFLATFLKHFILNGTTSISQLLDSISRYLSKSLSIGRFALSSRTYWGTLGWTNNWIMDNITDFIWLIQAFAVTGFGMLFFSKKKYPNFLPAKKYVVFLIGMTLALQLGIRVADWSIFNQSGSLDLGTPGRYFLPNLITHIILVFTGLGMFFSYFKKEKYFDYSLVISLILMFAFSTYLIFDVIIFRFYL